MLFRLFQHSVSGKKLQQSVENESQLADSHIRDIAKLIHPSERSAFFAGTGMPDTHSIESSLGEAIRLAKEQIHSVQHPSPEATHNSIKHR